MHPRIWHPRIENAYLTSSVNNHFYSTFLFYFKILCGIIYWFKLVHVQHCTYMHVLEKICTVTDHGVFKNTSVFWPKHIIISSLELELSLWNRGSAKVAIYSNKYRDSVKIKSAMASLMCTGSKLRT